MSFSPLSRLRVSYFGDHSFLSKLFASGHWFYGVIRRGPLSQFRTRITWSPKLESNPLVSDRESGVLREKNIERGSYVIFSLHL